MANIAYLSVMTPRGIVLSPAVALVNHSHLSHLENNNSREFLNVNIPTLKETVSIRNVDFSLQTFAERALNPALVFVSVCVALSAVGTVVTVLLMMSRLDHITYVFFILGAYIRSLALIKIETFQLQAVIMCHGITV